MIATLLCCAALLPVESLGLVGSPTCVFRSATGLPCPLCGGTRATHALLRGDLSRAVYLNMAALPGVAALMAIAFVLAYEALRGSAVANWSALLRQSRSFLPMMVCLFFFYWLVHLRDAVRGSKSELVDLRNPVAGEIHKRFSGGGR
jgi:hypothetical protein